MTIRAAYPIRRITGRRTNFENPQGTGVSRLIAQDPEVARVFWGGLNDRASLSETDRQRFDALRE